MSIPALAKEASVRLNGMLSAGLIAAINIDVIRVHCAVVAQYQMLSPHEATQLEEQTLRRVVEAVG